MTYSSKVSFLEHENRTKKIIFHQKIKIKVFFSWCSFKKESLCVRVAVVNFDFLS